MAGGGGRAAGGAEPLAARANARGATPLAATVAHFLRGKRRQVPGLHPGHATASVRPPGRGSPDAGARFRPHDQPLGQGLPPGTADNSAGGAALGPAARYAGLPASYVRRGPPAAPRRGRRMAERASPPRGDARRSSHGVAHALALPGHLYRAGPADPCVPSGWNGRRARRVERDRGAGAARPARGGSSIGSRDDGRPRFPSPVSPALAPAPRSPGPANPPPPRPRAP